MQANRDKIIDAFKDGTFLSENLKKSDAPTYDYVLKDVNDFIQEIKSMEEKINLNLFEDFSELLPADYAKTLINIRNADENKKNCSRGKRQNIKFKRQNKRNEWCRKKYKNADETLKIIEKILDYNKDTQKIFQHASKVDKKKIKTKT